MRATLQLNKAMSAYLDCVRFTAAAIVFVSHAGSQEISGGFLWQAGTLNQEAVAVFFVLSGFVIFYTVTTRRQSAKDYVVNRAARVYSVALPALLLTFAADAAGSALRPHLYQSIWDYSATDRPWQLLNGLLFSSQLWFNHIRIGTNFPYWSIGFEVWYYVAFGLAVFAPRGWALPAMGGALAIAGPKIAVLFPIWLLGAGACWACKRRLLGQGRAALVWIGSLGLLVASKWFGGRHYPLYLEFSPAMPRVGDYAYYYVVGLLFAANLVGFHGLSASVTYVPSWLSGSARWLGDRTFSLYLYHLPLLFLGAALVPWPPTTPQTRLLVFIGTPALIFLLAELTEQRKQAWRRAFASLWEFCHARPFVRRKG